MRTKLMIALLTGACVYAGLEGSYVLPVDEAPILYSKTPVNDPVARLQQEVDTGKVELGYDANFGYLPAVLRALKTPVSSQVMVFSKTSFQAPKISPRLPRALYFNNDVYVGYVRGGDVLEFASTDPKQGTIFYTLDQEKTAKPHFTRQEQCVHCHAAGGTLGVPGLMVRSIVPDRTGMPVFQAGSYLTDHRSPFEERFGGWYVSGTHGDMKHMGNALSGDPAGGNITDLSKYFDTGAYLAPDSDLVALMILQHQTRMHNLITRVGFETRIALYQQEGMNKALGEPEGTRSDSTTRRINSAAEELVTYLLFADEFPLSAEVRGTSRFAEEYQRNAAPRDKKGRSLADLDLKRRMLKYPCSPLIYTDAFRSMPAAAKDRIYRRLWDVLTGSDKSATYSKLSGEDRTAIREILIDTDHDLPSYWKN